MGSLAAIQGNYITPEVAVELTIFAMVFQSAHNSIIEVKM